MDKVTYDKALAALLAIEECVDRAIAELEVLKAAEIHNVTIKIL